MAFSIKIITTEQNLVSQIQLAIEPLNQVQREFTYDLASERLLEDSFYFKKDDYILVDIFTFLRTFRTKARGNLPFIILITGGRLTGQLTNLFGSHKAAEGLAVFTMDAFDSTRKQFLFDEIRFIRYYLVRYSLSFVAPDIKSHDTNGCMFDKKLNKAEILLSLNTGKICAKCEAQLKSSQLCNFEVEASLASLRKVVSNAHPRALVMKGGGVKGLALVGAMLELEKYFIFDTFSGTSAGAIAATLLGAGYKPQELLDIFQEKNFKDFTDNIFKVAWNLLTKSSLNSGDHITVWLNKLLRDKLGFVAGTNVKMKHFKRHSLRTVIYANRVGEGPVTFDSDGDHDDDDAAYATRCSMSIPFYFQPTLISGVRGYDGGLGNNFPLRKFISENKKSLFIGLYLMSEIKEKSSKVIELINIVTDADERKVVDENIDKIVVIDPNPIKTTQFNLSEKEKEFLIMAGKLGALKYLNLYHKDFGVTQEEVIIMRDQVEALKKDMKTSIFSRFKNPFKKTN